MGKSSSLVILGAAFFLLRCVGKVGPDGVDEPPPPPPPAAAAAAAALWAGGIYFAGAFGVDSSLGAGGSTTGAGTKIKKKLYISLTLVLLNPHIPAFANSVDPDQLASEEAN